MLLVITRLLNYLVTSFVSFLLLVNDWKRKRIIKDEKRHYDATGKLEVE